MKRKTKDGADFLVGNALVGWRRQRDREKKREREKRKMSFVRGRRDVACKIVNTMNQQKKQRTENSPTSRKSD